MLQVVDVINTVDLRLYECTLTLNIWIENNYVKFECEMNMKWLCSYSSHIHIQVPFFACQQTCHTRSKVEAGSYDHNSHICLLLIVNNPSSQLCQHISLCPDNFQLWFCGVLVFGGWSLLKLIECRIKYEPRFRAENGDIKCKCGHKMLATVITIIMPHYGRGSKYE